MDGELVVFAAAVVNSVGDVLAEDGTVLAGARAEDGSWLVNQDPWRRFPERPPVAGTNTTLVLVATNAHFSKTQAQILAQRAQDGVAIAVRPRTIHDGDTAFALSTGAVEASFNLVSNMVLEMSAAAIRNGVRHAQTAAGIPGLAG
jgi:L-aminopeptidase/D-esterase-like protein